MPLTPDDVETCFRCILGRSPESERTIQYHLDHFQSFHQLRRHLLGTDEFLNTFGQIRGDADQWGPDPAAEKLVFLHLQKTGGTTLIRLLEQHYPPAEVFPDHYRLGPHQAYVLSRHRLFHGHYRLRDTAFIPGPKYVATLLREPRARIISQYNFHRSKRPDPAEPNILVNKARLDLNEYLSDPEVRRDVNVDNLQTRQLFYLSDAGMRQAGIDPLATRDPFFRLPRRTILEVAMANLRQLDCVGVTERFDDFAALLFADRGLPPPPAAAPRRMVTRELPAIEPGHYERTDYAEPDAAGARLLDELVELDTELHRLAGTLLDARLRAAPARPQPARRGWWRRWWRWGSGGDERRA